MTLLIREDQVYTRCYCEENIYMMCKSIAEKATALLDRFTVVFISNPNKKVNTALSCSFTQGTLQLYPLDPHMDATIMPRRQSCHLGKVII